MKRTYDLVEQRIKSVSGTLAIEGIELSEQSINNINRYVSGEATYEQLLNEIKDRYADHEKSKEIS